jgi:hypothetical protein
MTKLSKLLVLSCATLAVFTFPAAAQSVLELSGEAQQTCALTNPASGTIALNPDLRSWATSQAAKITVTNTSAETYTLTATRSDAWKAGAPAGTPVTTFEHVPSIASGVNAGATFQGTGVTKSTLLTNAGEDTFNVSITASASSPFKAGLHATEVTVTCATP